MPFSLFFICQRSRQLNTRSSQFFSQVPALINGKQPLPVSSCWEAIFIHRFPSEVTLHNNLVDSLTPLQSSSSRMKNGPVLLTHKMPARPGTFIRSSSTLMPLFGKSFEISPIFMAMPFNPLTGELYFLKASTRRRAVNQD